MTTTTTTTMSLDYIFILGTLHHRNKHPTAAIKLKRKTLHMNKSRPCTKTTFTGFQQRIPFVCAYVILIDTVLPYEFNRMTIYNICKTCWSPVEEKKTIANFEKFTNEHYGRIQCASKSFN